MNKFSYYFEFVSKSAVASKDLINIENFFKEKKLYFLFTIDSVNKSFNRTTGLKYETGGGYNYNKGNASFVFCGYRGPSLEKLKEEIVLNFKKDNNALENIKKLDDENLDFKKNIKSLYSKRNAKALEKKDLERNIKYLKNNKVLIKDLERKALFDWLKEKKYIFCVEYFMNINGPHGDTCNLSFDNTGKNDNLNLYELNLLLTKIFKIYLIDDAFKLSSIFKTTFIGSSTSRDILYKKFLTKYLSKLPGRPYRLFHTKTTNQKYKNLLRKKGENISKEDMVVAEGGLVIVPKKIYLRKILQNKTIEEFVKILQRIDKLTSYNIENKKTCINFINDKISQKEAEDKLKNINIKEIIDYCLQAKKEKKEIDDILSKQRKKISFNEFINQYINLSNKTDYTKNINNKILQPSRSKELMFRHEHEMNIIVLISDFIKDNNIKFDKMENITLEKITERIELVKNKISFLQKKIEDENAINIKKDEVISKKIEDEREKVRVEMKKKQDLNYHKEALIYEKHKLISIKDEKNTEDKLKNVKKQIEDVDKEIESLDKEIEAMRKQIDIYVDQLEPIIDEIEKNEKEIEKYKKIIVGSNFLIKNLFTEKTIKKYGYNSLKNMITDIYRSNLFNSKQIKSFLFEMNIVRSNFQFYLFFN